MNPWGGTWNSDNDGQYGDTPSLDESCLHPRHTVAGINERADTLTGPYGTRSQYQAARMELLRESIETAFGGW